MCSVKSLIKIALGLGVLLILGYAIFPLSRPFIAAIAPYLLFLTCPIAMYFMMQGQDKSSQKKEKQPDQHRKE